MMNKLWKLLLILFIVASCNPGTKIPERPDVAAPLAAKPKHVILMIGDGMGFTQISAAAVMNGGDLNMFRFTDMGMIKTHSADNLITDSGAGATAISTGHKTFNGGIGINSTGRSVPTILELAKQKGKSTGMVVTSSITHATPAAFVAHIDSRDKEEEIALAFLDAGVDVFIGGGKKFFDVRKDKRFLTEELRKKGYKTATGFDQIKKARTKKLAGFIADGDPERVETGRDDYLQMAWLKAYSILQRNSMGYFLMIEGSQIDWGGHANNGDYVISELLDFDKVVGQVLDLAMGDGQTLVIVTADHETGGMGINGGSMIDREVQAGWTTNKHTGAMVPVFAYGPGAEHFRGVYDNTDIFHKLKMLFID